MFVTAKVRVLTDWTGAYTELPGLTTPAGVLTPLLDYCLSRSHDRSLAWMDKVIRSVQMFLEYMHCNPAESDSHILFRNFAQRLYSGTFSPSTGLDPSGLCWPARAADDARHIITNLTDFFDWLGTERAAAAEVNPRYAGGAYDRLCDDAAYRFRRDKAFLGHIWSPEATSTGHRVRSQRVPLVEAAEPPAFPDERFDELLEKGFRVGGRYDYRGILITLLLHGAGFRESEPFHLYIGDVVPDPINLNSAKVRIHHPSQGYAPDDWRDEKGLQRKGNRAAYLMERYGLVPRTQMLDSRRAGWKGGTHDGRYYKEAYWFEPHLGELFLAVWHRYLHQVARVDRLHPFAFVNLGRAPVGEMYGLPKYLEAHAAACERIGLKVAKSLGTTPHGHRHAYGRRLSCAKVDQAFIRRFMHHASIESQGVYTQATTREVQEELTAASQRLRALSNSAHPNLALPSALLQIP